MHHSDGLYRGGFMADEFFAILPLINETGDKLEIFLRDRELAFERNVRECLRERPQLRETPSSIVMGIRIGPV